ncbi:MAG: prepilin-type N-terminal cleavage/methylation domain-containing protein [Thermoanaerobaculia bacterium]
MSGPAKARCRAEPPRIAPAAGFTVLEMVVALVVLAVGLLLVAGVLIESHRMLAQVGVELRAPEVDGALDLLRAELQGAAGVSGGPPGGGPGWSRDRLVLVRPDGARVAYRRDGRRLVRRWNGSESGRTAVPDLVSWRWRRVGPRLVTVEVVWEAGERPAGVVASPRGRIEAGRGWRTERITAALRGGGGRRAW